jgi:hypothetical protein
MTPYSVKSIVITKDNAKVSRDGIVTVARQYRVESFSAGDTSLQILNAQSSDGSKRLPQVGDPFDHDFYPSSTASPSFYGAWVSDIDVEHDHEEPTFFDVAVQSIGLAEQFGGGLNYSSSGPNTVLCWNIKVQGNSQLWSEPISRDYSASSIACVNKIGEPINPPLMNEVGDQNYTFTFNRNTVSPHISEPDYLTVCDDCLFKINPSAILITVDGQPLTFAANCLKLISVSKDFDYLAQLWSFGLTLTYRPTSFIQKYQSQSTYVLSSSSATSIVPMLDQNNNEITSPQFHNSTGTDYIRNGGTLPPPLQFQANIYSSNYGNLFFGLST